MKPEVADFDILKARIRKCLEVMSQWICCH